MKRILLMLFVAAIAVAALPFQQARANLYNECNNFNYCMRNLAQCRKCHLGSINQDENPHGQRQLLAAAYLNANKQPPRPSSQSQPARETALRRHSAIGLSLLILLVGLAALARLGWRGLAPWLGRPTLLGRAFGHSLRPALAGWLMIALVSSALVKGNVPRPTARQPDAVTASRAAPHTSLAPAGSFTSALEIGGTGTTQIGGTAFDAAGNLYVTGGFTGQILFNTTPQTTLASTQDYDLFVAKYNVAGQCLWARLAAGATGLPPGFSLDGGLAVAVDQQGNSFVGGGFVSQLAFKDGAGQTVATLGDDNSDINFEPFVAKYDTQGTLLWAQGGGSGTPDDPEAEADLDAGVNGITEIVVDGAGNPYVAGTVAGANFLGTAVSLAGTSDLVLARLDPQTGVPEWVTAAGGAQGDSVTGLGLDQAANIYLSGYVSDDAIFPTQALRTLTQSVTDDGFQNAIIAKYNPQGQLQWVGVFDGSEEVYSEHLAVTEAGDIYATGYLFGNLSFSSGTGITENENGFAGFLVKINTQGTVLWARELGEPGERVALDGAGNPFVTGVFYGQARFGAEHPPTAQTLTSQGDEDQYVAKYDALGNFHFAKALPGDGTGSENLIGSDSVSAKIIPMRLLYNPATCQMHVSGDFQGTLTLDQITLNSGADRHGFVAALDAAFTVFPKVRTFPANGGTDSVNVTAGCNRNWTATSNSPELAAITSGSSGTGNGTVNYSVLAHTATTPRTGTLTIAEQSFLLLQGANFNDVPQNHPFSSFIGKLSARGITQGCGGGNFCPDDNVTREQMAIFIERALGNFNPPTPMQQTFMDVPPSLPGYPFIENFAARGITAGCAGGPPRLYCPAANVTREQVAIFILRALGVFTPPTAPTTPTFDDVPNSGATDISHEFIEEFYRRGITSGCAGGPSRLYCPAAPVTRGQMAVFLVRAFGL